MRTWMALALGAFACRSTELTDVPVVTATGPSATTHAEVAPSASDTVVEATAAPRASPTPSPTGGSVLVGDIAAPPQFNPKPTIDGVRSELVRCYNRARSENTALHGKLKLRIVINESGAVEQVEAEPGGSANDPVLIACIADTMRTVAFPKPGGTATVIAPLVFRP